MRIIAWNRAAEQADRLKTTRVEIRCWQATQAGLCSMHVRDEVSFKCGFGDLTLNCIGHSAGSVNVDTLLWTAWTEAEVW